MEELFKEFEFNDKPEQLITSVSGMPLPEDYLSFMKEHNGGEGPIGENNYGRFYRLEELQEINDTYDVQTSWPGYIVIGGIDDDIGFSFVFKGRVHGISCRALLVGDDGPVFL